MLVDDLYSGDSYLQFRPCFQFARYFNLLIAYKTFYNYILFIIIKLFISQLSICHLRRIWLDIYFLFRFIWKRFFKNYCVLKDCQSHFILTQQFNLLFTFLVCLSAPLYLITISVFISSSWLFTFSTCLFVSPTLYIDLFAYRTICLYFRIVCLMFQVTFFDCLYTMANTYNICT